jgi:hypothetical protein
MLFQKNEDAQKLADMIAAESVKTEETSRCFSVFRDAVIYRIIDGYIMPVIEDLSSPLGLEIMPVRGIHLTRCSPGQLLIRSSHGKRSNRPVTSTNAVLLHRFAPLS